MNSAVENIWVQSRLVGGRLVVLAVRGGIAPLQRPRYCLHVQQQHNTTRWSIQYVAATPPCPSHSVVYRSHATRGTLFQ
jgi:hypothetical protein